MIYQAVFVRSMICQQVNNSIIMQRNITLTAQVVITLETVKNLKDIGVREVSGFLLVYYYNVRVRC